MIHFSDLLDAWGTALWRASWQGGLVALAVWSACWLAPSMPARFQSWLWRLVTLKFLVALLWAAPLGLPLLPASEPANWEARNPTILTEAAPVSVGVAHLQTSSLFTPWLIPFIAWTIVVGWQAARMLAAFRDARRPRKSCRPSRNMNLLNHLARLSKSAGLDAPPSLLEMDGPGSPLLVGIRRPAIVLPTGTLSRLDEAERALVLGHELAHVKRGDVFWSLLATIVRAVFFFHPLAWLSERKTRLTQEIAADELAIALQNQDPVSYATLLVSVVSKLGPNHLFPALSVGVAGSQRSLKRRLFAMRFVKSVSRKSVIAYGIVLGMVAVLGVVPWTLVAAQAPAADKVEQKEKVSQQAKGIWGKFVSFKDDILTIKANSGALLENKIPENAKTVVWNDSENSYKPAATAEVLNQAKPGTWFAVLLAKDNVTIRIGAKKNRTTGTFLSFKNDRLLMLGKDLGPSFTKKYGNNLHFNKFAANVPVHESIDGGEYKLVGNAETVLPTVKEGTTLVVHAEGDDNITLIQIGVQKKNNPPPAKRPNVNGKGKPNGPDPAQADTTQVQPK